VLQTLESDVSIIRAITMPAQRGQR
jgi:hypothetical protein